MIHKLKESPRDLQDSIAFLTAVISKAFDDRPIAVEKKNCKWKKVGTLKIKEERES